MRTKIKLHSLGTGAQNTLSFTNLRSLSLKSIFILGCSALAAGAHVDDDQESAEKLNTARAAMTQWVETQRIISKEKHDWVIGKELLDDRILLVEREIESLRARLGETLENIADADKKRAELIAKNEEFKQAATSLRDAATPLEVRTKDLAERLPEPTRNSLQSLIQRLPDGSKESELSLSKRFQYVVGILNAVDKANQNVELTSEVRTLSDGTRAEVATFYIGVARAYYVNVDNTLAGIGTPAAGGWNWVAANDEAAQIARAVAILKDEETAAFVRLPIERRSRRKK